MTRRMIAARAIDAEHRRLMLAYRAARGGERTRAWRRLRDYVASLLEAA